MNKFVKIGVDLIDHPKMIKVGAAGFALYVGGQAYSQRHLTNGFIPKEAVPTLAPDAWFGDELDPATGRTFIQNGTRPVAVRRLVRSGLWQKVDGGYQIYNYLEWHRSKDEVEKVRAQTRDRVRRLRTESESNDDRT